MFAEEEDDGRDDVGEGDFLVLHDGAEFLDFKFGHHDGCQAAVEGLVD